MKRRHFLRTLGVGAAAAAVPLSLVPVAEAEKIELYRDGIVIWSGRGAGASQYAAALAKSMWQTKERVFAQVLANAFESL